MSAPPTSISPSTRSSASSGCVDERRVGREQQRHARRRAGPRRGSCAAAAPPAGPTRSTGALERGADADDGTRCHAAPERSRRSTRARAHAQNRDAPVTFPGSVCAMEENARQLDFDWLVIGSGFGGSVVGAAAGREGLPRRACSSAAGASATRTSPSSTWNLRALLLGAAARACAGILRLTLFKDVFVVSRLRRRRRQPRLREHALRAARRVLPRPAVGRAGRLGGRARAALRRPPSGCSASPT